MPLTFELLAGEVMEMVGATSAMAGAATVDAPTILTSEKKKIFLLFLNFITVTIAVFLAHL